MKEVRTHDLKVYLEEDRKNTPKEYFKFANSLCSDFISQKKAPRVLDIGCATGDFLFFLSQMHPNAVLSGMDILPELIDVAKKEVQDCEFFMASIQNEAQLPNKKFDVIFMFGVCEIFDDCAPWINNVSKLLDDGGRAYVYDVFNNDDIDVITRVRSSGSDGSYEFGWNSWSKKTIGSHLEKMKMNYCFKDFHIGIDLEKKPEDPMRTWTVKLESGERLTINGAGMIRCGRMLIFSKEAV
jgi:SAM-dependent methyltransferase